MLLEEQEVKSYLEVCITLWRQKYSDLSIYDREEVRDCQCYIDAFQSVYTTLFGKVLDK